MITIPYLGKPYAQTHPDRLAVIARLFGHRTHDVATCRMLEIGCGDGTNLIGIASSLPDAHFVGIDLSNSAIAQGRQLARQAGIKNVQLTAIDLCDYKDQAFDYIVAHGVYSWVRAPIRDALIKLCAQSLTASGVAMISYATYPGGFVEQLIRAPMLFRAATFTTPDEKIEAARAFASRVANSVPTPALRDLFKEELAKIPPVDGFLLYDQLVEEYAPVYFTEFTRHAAAHGLKYLAEAGGDSVNTEIATEQCLDFLRCRRFRQTILCRESMPLRSRPILEDCYAAAPPYLGSLPTLPALDAAWPGFIPCDESMLPFFTAGRIELRTVPPPVGSTERPRATALARVQADSDKPITNLLHHEVKIEDEFTRKLIAMLDGRRTRHQLIEEVAKRSAAPEKVASELDRILTMLAHHALLRH
jgi:SAM-dependent methyltransferase